MKLLPHDHGQTTHDILEKLPSVEQSREVAVTFSALGDASRLRILWILCHCEDCVSNIAAAVDMSIASVSHHLKILRLSGIITSRRDGKEIYYSISKNSTAELVHKIIEECFEIVCPIAERSESE
jgi:DNA-binding transcriptional ArsR family regulator